MLPLRAAGVHFCRVLTSTRLRVSHPLLAPLRVTVAFACAGLGSTGCAGEGVAERANTTALQNSVPVAASLPHDVRSAAEGRVVASAEAALAGWLDRSREAGASGHALETTRLSAESEALRATVAPAGDCDEGDAYFPSPLLASWRLLSTQLRGDTVVARVMVTTVAEQDIDRRAQDRFVARMRVRSDLMEWDVVPTDDGWRVCNGIRFGYRGADSLTRWIPEGSSYARASALADSVRKAQP